MRQQSPLCNDDIHGPHVENDVDEAAMRSRWSSRRNEARGTSIARLTKASKGHKQKGASALWVPPTLISTARHQRSWHSLSICGTKTITRTSNSAVMQRAAFLRHRRAKLIAVSAFGDVDCERPPRCTPEMIISNVSFQLRHVKTAVCAFANTSTATDPADSATLTPSTGPAHTNSGL